MRLPELVQSPLPATGEGSSLQAAARLPGAGGLPSLCHTSSSADRARRFYHPPRRPSAAGLAAERAHTRCLCLVRVRSHAEHPAPNLAQAPPPPSPPALAPAPPAMASWPPPPLLSSGVLHAEPPPPARGRSSLPGCWRGPPAPLHPCSVSSQGRAMVPGWEEGVTLRVTVPLRPNAPPSP